jgi:mannosyltransferase
VPPSRQGAIAQAAFVGRYTSVVFPFFVIIVGLGTTVFADRRIQAVVLALVASAGLFVGVSANGNQRSQAGVLASVINTESKPGDLVVYCPDQLGPGTSRLITAPGLTQLTFPRALAPGRVDWVDYKKVVGSTSVENFAEQMVSRAGTGTIWYVWRDGYPTFGADCGNLYNWLAIFRPHTTEVVAPDPGRYYEYAGIDQFSS